MSDDDGDDKGLTAAEVRADDHAYARLYQKQSDIIEAAIRSDILNQGFRDDGDGEYYLSPDEVRLYADGSMYRIGEGYIPDLAGWSPRERRDHFVQAVGEAFADFESLPAASASQPALSAAGAASNAISVDVGSKGGYDIQAGDPGYAKGLTRALALQGFHGNAMDALNSTITASLLTVAARQYAAVSVVGVAIQAEQRVWQHARHDVLAIADQAIDAMKNANSFTGNGGSDGELPDWLTVVAGVAGAATIFFTGGVAGAALGAVSTAVGSLARFQAATDEPTPNALGASTPDDVLGKLNQAFDQLRTNIADAEHRIYNGCSHARSTIIADIADYSFKRPAVLDDEDARDYVDPEGTTEFDLQTLQHIGNSYLPDIAEALTRAATHNDRADDAGAFDRPAGLGANPYSAVYALQQEVGACLRDSAWKLRETGEQLDLFARDFRALDEDRGADARRIERRIHREVLDRRAGSGEVLVPATPKAAPGGGAIAI